MAGRFSSIVFGIVNMMGNGAGFLVPQVMGKILNEKDQGNPQSWTYVFGIPCKSLKWGASSQWSFGPNSA